MIKALLFLVLGICLKETIDQAKALLDLREAELKAQREALTTYRPPLLAKVGSPEAARLQGEHRHRQAVAPQVLKIGKQIKRRQYAKVAVPGVVTVVILVLALLFVE